MKNLIVLMIWSLVLPLSAATLEFPAEGNFNIEEGTIEMWVIPDIDVYKEVSEGKSKKVLGLFGMKADEFGFSCEWQAKRSKKAEKTGWALRVSMSSTTAKGALLPVPGSNIPKRWQKGKLHHLAFVWKEGVMSMYCDGTLAGKRKQSGWFSGNLGTGKLIFGDAKYKHTTKYRIHAIRTSGVAREETDLANAKPEQDLATLLLQVFDKPETVKGDKTLPQQSSALNGDKTGTIVGGGHFAPGKVPVYVFGGGKSKSKDKKKGK